MTSVLTLTALYEEVEGGWVQARLVEIPGVITAAPTQAEVQDLLVDALREYLLSFTEPAASESADGTSAQIEVVIRPGAA